MFSLKFNMNNEKCIDKVTPDNVTMVIYHGPVCTDGYGSRFAIEHYNKLNSYDRDIKYIPCNYGHPPPDVTGHHVAIVDFSFKYPILIEMIKQANGLIVIDHHKTARDDLSEIDTSHKIFDMNHSGAFLTWKWCFPDEPVPLLIRYIEDRDLWRNEMDNSMAFAQWFFSVPKEYDQYLKYLDSELVCEMIQLKGIPQKEVNDKIVNDVVPFACPKFMEFRDRKKNRYYHFIAHVNTNVLISDVGNAIFNQFPLVDASCIYYINDWSDSVKYSLRSTYDRADVSKLASMFGGGGHRNAAGAYGQSMSNTLPGTVLDNGRLYDILPSIYFHNLSLSYFTGEDTDDVIQVVYLNSPIFKKKLGRYLLQELYTSIDGEPKIGVDPKEVDSETEMISVARSIALKLGKEDPGHIDLAVVYHFDGECTKFEMTYNTDSLYTEQLNEYIENRKLDDDDPYTVSVNGMAMYLN